MTFLDASFATPEENLACDEALLDSSEEESGGEVLRVWESASHFVVLGISNVAATEVDLEACRTRGIPVLRRHSGGGSVLQGPGCLNYALILRIPASGPLSTIAGTNSYIMSRLAGVVGPLLGAEVGVMGQSDLTAGTKKFSGNAQRRRQRFLLFHGTFLLALDIGLMEAVLPFPSKAPSYRQNRPHRAFLSNLGLESSTVKSALKKFWGAGEGAATLPEERIRRLVTERYSQRAWNYSR